LAGGGADLDAEQPPGEGIIYYMERKGYAEMSDDFIETSLMILYVLQIPLLVSVCIYNVKILKKKGRAAAPFVWLTIGLWIATLIGFTLLWSSLDLTFPNHGHVMGFLTVFLTLCGYAASVLLAKHALNGEDEQKKRRARSLRPEHFSSGRTFSRSAFDHWMLESRKCAKKALTVYLCCVGGGIVLGVLFSKAIGGVGGNVMAVLCILAGLITGGVFSKKTGRTADNAAACLGVSKTDVATAKRHLKNGTFAWRDETPATDEEATPAKEKESVPKEAESQTDGKHPRKKMKKWLKIALIAAGGLAAAFLCFVAIVFITYKTQEKNETAFYDCLHASDVSGAQEYAKKLTRKGDTYYQDKVDHMERFVALYDAGDWQEAIAEYDSEGWFVWYGIALAKYCECYYQTQVLPAETALDEGRVRDAIELLLQFQNRFKSYTYFDVDIKSHIGSYRDYSEYFEDHSRHFIDLTERAAQAALATGDADTILLLDGFDGDTVKTVPFEEFPWSEDYLAWKMANEMESEPGDTDDVEQKRSPLENGGSVSLNGTDFLQFPFCRLKVCF